MGRVAQDSMDAARALVAGVVLGLLCTPSCTRGAPPTNAEDSIADVRLDRPVAVPENIEDVASQLGIGRFVDLWKEAVSSGDEPGVAGYSSPDHLPLTIFAPSDTWLARKFHLSPGDSGASARTAAITEFIHSHVAHQESARDDEDDSEDLQTLAGARVRVRRSPIGAFVNGLRLSASDLRLPGSSSTVIHVIEGLLCCNESEALTAAKGQNLIELLPAVHASTFRSLLHQTDCDTSLDPPGVYTVFVPTDDSFARLDPALLNALKADPAQLKNVLLYHVVPGRLALADLRHGQPITTKMGNVLLPNVPPTTDNQTRPVVVSGARVLRADIFSRNGVVHVIDRVLTTVPHGHLLHTLANRTEFSGFLSRLAAANITRLLVGRQPLTIFAPTNDALDRQKQDGGELTAQDLLDHVVVGPIFAANMESEQPLTCLSGRQLSVEHDQGGDVRVGGVPLFGDEILATNGVIHPIQQTVRPSHLTTDSPIDQPGGIHGLPPFGRSTPRPHTGPHGLTIGKSGHGSILDVIQLVLQRVIPLRTMVTSLLVTRIGQDLRTRGPFTVFVPNDAAFKQHKPPLFVMLIKNNTYVRELLYNHLVPGTYTCADLANRNSLTTIRGQVLQLSSSDDGQSCPRVNGARIIQPDVSATNGIVHVVEALVWSGQMIQPTDRSLEPTGILKRLEEMGAFIMASLLRKSGLVPMLDEQGPFTILIPMDTAWERLPASVQQHFDVDLPALRDLLLYHVIQREVLLKDLRDTQILNSSSGLAVPVRIYHRPSGQQVITMSGAPIVERDFYYRGGILILCTKVVFPVPQGDILTTLAGWSENPVHRTFSALQLIPELTSSIRTFTVFCPEDSAYDVLAIPFNELIEMQVQTVADLLKGHVVEGTYFMAGLDNGTTLTTIGQQELQVRREANGVTINGVPIAVGDIVCTNGVIHIVPSILIISIIPFAEKIDKDVTTSRPLLDSDFTPDLRAISTAKPREEKVEAKPSYPTEDYSQETSAELPVVTEVSAESVTGSEPIMSTIEQLSTTVPSDEDRNQTTAESPSMAPGVTEQTTFMKETGSEFFETTLTTEQTDSKETLLPYTEDSRETKQPDELLSSTDYLINVSTVTAYSTVATEGIPEMQTETSLEGLTTSPTTEVPSTWFETFTTLPYLIAEVFTGKLPPESESKLGNATDVDERVTDTEIPFETVTTEVEELTSVTNATELPDISTPKAFTGEISSTSVVSTEIKKSTMETNETKLPDTTTKGITDATIMPNITEEGAMEETTATKIEDTTQKSNETEEPETRRPKDFTGELPQVTTETSEGITETPLQLNITDESATEESTVVEVEETTLGPNVTDVPAIQLNITDDIITEDSTIAELEETTLEPNVTEVPELRRPKDFTRVFPEITTELSEGITETERQLNITDDGVTEEITIPEVEETTLEPNITELPDARRPKEFTGEFLAITTQPSEGITETALQLNITDKSTTEEIAIAELEDTTLPPNATELPDVRRPKEFTGEFPEITTEPSEGITETAIQLNITDKGVTEEITVPEVEDITLLPNATELPDLRRPKEFTGQFTVVTTQPSEGITETATQLNFTDESATEESTISELEETTLEPNITKVPDLHRPKEFTGEFPEKTTQPSEGITETSLRLNITEESATEESTIAEFGATTLQPNITEVPDLRRPKEFTGEFTEITTQPSEGITKMAIQLNFTDESATEESTISELEETTLQPNVTEVPDLRRPKEITGEFSEITTQPSEGITETAIQLNFTDESTKEESTIAELEETTLQPNVTEVPDLRRPKEFAGEFPEITTKPSEGITETAIQLNFTDESPTEESTISEFEETTLQPNVTEVPDVRRPMEFTGEFSEITTQPSDGITETAIQLNFTDERATEESTIFELEETTLQSNVTEVPDLRRPKEFTGEFPDITIQPSEGITETATQLNFTDESATEKSTIAELEGTTLQPNVTEVPDLRRPKEFTGEFVEITTQPIEGITETAIQLNFTDESATEESTIAELKRTTLQPNVTEVPDLRRPKEFTGEFPEITTQPSEGSTETAIQLNFTDESATEESTISELEEKTLQPNVTEVPDLRRPKEFTGEFPEITTQLSERITETVIQLNFTDESATEGSTVAELEDTTLQPNITEVPDLRRPKEFTGEFTETTTQPSEGITETAIQLKITDESATEGSTVAELEDTTLQPNVTEVLDLRRPKEFTGEFPEITTQPSEGITETAMQLNITDESATEESTIAELEETTLQPNVTEVPDLRRPKVFTGEFSEMTTQPSDGITVTAIQLNFTDESATEESTIAESEETTLQPNVTELPDLRRPKEFTGEFPEITTQPSEGITETVIQLNITDESETEESTVVEMEETTLQPNVTKVPDLRTPTEFTGEFPEITTEPSEGITETAILLNITDESATEESTVVELEETTLQPNVTEVPDLQRPKEFTGELPEITTQPCEGITETAIQLNITDESATDESTVVELEATTPQPNVTEVLDLRRPKEFTGELPEITTQPSEGITETAILLNITDESATEESTVVELEETTPQPNITEVPDLRRPKEFTGELPEITTQPSERITETTIKLNITDKNATEESTIAELEETTLQPNLTEVTDLRRPKEFTEEFPEITTHLSEGITETPIQLNITDEVVTEEITASAVEETTLGPDITQLPDVRTPKEFTGEFTDITTQPSEGITETSIQLNITDEGVTEAITVPEVEETTLEPNITQELELRRPKEFTGEFPDITTQPSERITETTIKLNITDKNATEESTIAELEETTPQPNVTEVQDLRRPKEFTGEFPEITTQPTEGITETAVQLNITDERETEESTIVELEETTLQPIVTEVPDLRRPKEFTGESLVITTQPSEGITETAQQLNITDESTTKESITVEFEDTTLQPNVTEVLDVRRPKEFTGEFPDITTQPSEGITETAILLNINDESATEESTAAELEETTLQPNVTEVPDVRRPKEFTGEFPDITTQQTEVITERAIQLNITDESATEESTVAEVEETTQEPYETEVAEAFSREFIEITTQPSEGITETAIQLNITDERATEESTAAELEETTLEPNVTAVPDVRRPKEFTGEFPDITTKQTEGFTETAIQLNFTEQSATEESTVAELEETTLEPNVTDVPDVRRPKEFTGEFLDITTQQTEGFTETAIQLNITDERATEESTAAELEETTLEPNVTEVPDVRRPKEFTGEFPDITTQQTEVITETAIQLNITDERATEESTAAELEETTLEPTVTEVPDVRRPKEFTGEFPDITTQQTEVITETAIQLNITDESATEKSTAAELEETTLEPNVTEVPDVRRPKEFTGEFPDITTQQTEVITETAIQLNITDERATEESTAAELEETTLEPNVTEVPDVRRPKEFTGEFPDITTQQTEVITETAIQLNITDERATEESTAAELEETTLEPNVTEVPDVRRPKEFTGEFPDITTQQTEVITETAIQLNITDERATEESTAAELEETTLEPNVTEVPDVRRPKEFTGVFPDITTQQTEVITETAIQLNITDERATEESTAAELEETTLEPSVTEVPDVRRPKEFTGEFPDITTQQTEVITETAIQLNITDERATEESTAAELEETTLEPTVTEVPDVRRPKEFTGEFPDITTQQTEVITETAIQLNITDERATEESTAAELEETTLEPNVTEVPDVRRPKEFTGEFPDITTQQTEVITETAIQLNITDESATEKSTAAELEETTLEPNVTEVPDVRRPKEFTGEFPDITTQQTEVITETAIQLNITDESATEKSTAAELEETTLEPNVTEVPDVRTPKEFTGEFPDITTQQTEVITETAIQLNITDESATEKSTAAELEETTLEPNVTEVPDVRRPKEFTGDFPDITTQQTEGITETAIQLNITDERATEESTAAELEETTLEPNVTGVSDVRRPKEFTGEFPDITTQQTEGITETAIQVNITDESITEKSPKAELEETTLEPNVTEVPDVRRPKEFTGDFPDITTQQTEGITETAIQLNITDERATEESNVAKFEETTLQPNVTEVADLQRPKEFTGEFPDITTQPTEDITETAIQVNITDESITEKSPKAELEKTTLKPNVTEVPDVRGPKEFTGEFPEVTHEDIAITGIPFNLSDITTAERLLTTEELEVVIIGNVTMTTPVFDATTLDSNATEIPGVRTFTGELLYKSTIKPDVVTEIDTLVNATDEVTTEISMITEELEVVVIGNDTLTTVSTERTTIKGDVTKLQMNFTGEIPYVTTDSIEGVVRTDTPFSIMDEFTTDDTAITDELQVVIIGNDTLSTLATHETTMEGNVTELPDIRMPKEFTGELLYTTEDSDGIVETVIPLNITGDTTTTQRILITEELEVVIVGNDTLSTPETAEITVKDSVTELLDLRKPKEVTQELPGTTPETTETFLYTDMTLNLTHVTITEEAITTEGIEIVMFSNDTATTSVTEPTSAESNFTQLPELRKPKEVTESPDGTTKVDENIAETETSRNTTDKITTESSIATEGIEVVIIGNDTLTTSTPAKEEITLETSPTELPEISTPKEFTYDYPYTISPTTDGVAHTAMLPNVTDEIVMPEKITTEDFATGKPEVEETTLETITTELPEIRQPKDFTDAFSYTTPTSSSSEGLLLEITTTLDTVVTQVIHLEKQTEFTESTSGTSKVLTDTSLTRTTKFHDVTTTGDETTIAATTDKYTVEPIVHTEIFADNRTVAPKGLIFNDTTTPSSSLDDKLTSIVYPYTIIPIVNKTQEVTDTTDVSATTRFTASTKAHVEKIPAKGYPSESSEFDVSSLSSVSEEQSVTTFETSTVTDTDLSAETEIMPSTSESGDFTREPKLYWTTDETDSQPAKTPADTLKTEPASLEDVGSSLTAETTTALSVTSLASEATEPPETIPEMMGILPLTKLKEMLEKAGLDKNISDGGPITIFAPTDSAFGSLGNQTLVSLLEQTDSLQEVLLYHCSPIRISVKDLVGLISAPTLSGQPVFINTYKNRGVTTVQVNGVPVQPIEHDAGNGVIFLIGQVLRPPHGNIVHIIDTQLHLSTLVAHMMQNEIYRLLQGRGPYTLFAPNEASWGKLPLKLIISFSQKPELLRDYLLSHIVKGAIFTSGLLDGNQLRTLNGAILNVRLNNGVTYVNNARIIKPDVSAENGVVHLIDNVITPLREEKTFSRPPVSSYPSFPPGWPFNVPPVLPPSVAVAPILQALSDANLTEFTKLVADTGLAELLQNMKAVTLLVPSDEVLRTLPQLPLSAIRRLVLHHVLPDVLVKANFSNGSWPTLRGGDVKITVPPNGQPIHVDGAVIVKADLPLPSGIAHVLNQILEPGNGLPDVWEALEKEMPELTQVVGDAELRQYLQDKKHLTLFAPSPGTWLQLPQELRDFLVFNRTAATEILLCHICPGNISSANFRPRMQLNSLCGKVLNIDQISNNSWTVNESPIIQMDIPARDGTIHIIDRLLFVGLVLPHFSSLPGSRDLHPVPAKTGPIVPISAPRPSQTEKPSGGGPHYPTESNESRDIESLLDSHRYASPVIPAVTSTPWDLEGLESGSGIGPRPLLTLTTGKFYRLLDDAMLSGNLATGGPYTIFAPTDTALDEVQNWENISQDSQRLRSVLLYHVVPGLVSLTDLFHGTELPTLAGKPIRLSATSKSVLVNDATVLGKQDREDDNRSYIIDRVLIPAPSEPIGKLVQDHVDLEALNHLLRGREAHHVLNGHSPITAFLPIDAAFYESDPTLLSQLRQNQSTLQGFVLGHIVPGTYYSGSLEDGQVLRSMSGQPLYISKTDGLKVNGANVVSPDITTSNGVIHFTDKILYGTDASALTVTPPPPPLIDHDVDLLSLASLLNLTVFVDLVELAGIQHELNSRSPHTLFIPTDDAFQTLPPSLFQELQSDKEKLKRLLRYHAVNGHLPVSSINNEMIRPSLLRNKDLRFNVYNTRFGKHWTASGSPVTRSDNEARNGRIHIVKQVLYVPWGNLLQTLDRSSILQSVTDAVKSTGLTSTLKGTTPFTFFAPSDEAFRDLPVAVQERLVKEPDLLRSLLLRHVVRGTFYSSGLADQVKLTPLSGPQLDIRALADCILVNNSTIIYPDVTANNGVVHVINRVL